MKRNVELLASGLLAALVSVSLTACDRPGEQPNRPTTTGSSDISQDSSTVAGNDAMGAGSPATTSGKSPGPNGAATSGATAPGTMIESHPTAAGTMSATPLSSVDRTFLRTAAEDGLYEVAAARVALERAKDPAVKEFALMLVDHHTTANEKLRQVASGTGVQLPVAVPADKQQVIDRLSLASGSDFDRQFIQQVGIKDHQTDISKFEQASQTAQSPAVKDFARKALPALRAHLTEAQRFPAQ